MAEILQKSQQGSPYNTVYYPVCGRADSNTYPEFPSYWWKEHLLCRKPIGISIENKIPVFSLRVYTDRQKGGDWQEKGWF